MTSRSNQAEKKSAAPEAEPVVQASVGSSAPPVAPPIAAQPESGKPVILATRRTQALALNDLGDHGVTITSDGVALSKADAKKAHEIAASCGVELIDKTPAAESDEKKGDD